MSRDEGFLLESADSLLVRKSNHEGQQQVAGGSKMGGINGNQIIQVDDLFELKPDLTSEEVVKRWYPIWDKELISEEFQVEPHWEE